MYTSVGSVLVCCILMISTERVFAVKFSDNDTQRFSTPSSLHVDGDVSDLPRYKPDHEEQCATWFSPHLTSNVTQCVCNGELRRGRVPIIICPSSSKQLNVSVRIGFCMTYEQSLNQTLLGACPFNPHTPTIYKYLITLPYNLSELNSFMCDSNTTGRTGFLCSECEDNLGPVLNSYDWICVECNGSLTNWLLFFTLTFLPATVFFIVVLCCKLRLTSGMCNSLLFMCQFMMCIIDGNINMFKAMIASRLEVRSNTWRILASFYEIWNLDFFTFLVPRYCLSANLTPLHVLSLSYLTPMYTLGLVVFVYILIQLHSRGCRLLVIIWRPFQVVLRKCFWDFDPLDSIVGTFATVLLLSYSKILQVSFRLLSPVKLGIASAHTKIISNAVYYDPTLKYLSGGHLPFVCLAVVILCVFSLLPLLFLALYPLRSFQRCLGLFPCVHWHPVHAFADVFQGCYKSGSNGKHDFRYFAAFYLLARIAFNSVFFFSYQMFWVVVLISSMITSVMFASAQPYKIKWLNFLDAFTFLLIGFGALWMACDMFLHPVGSLVIKCIVFFPFVCIICFGIRAIYTNKFITAICQKCYLKLKKSRVGSVLIGRYLRTLKDEDDDFPHDRSPLFIPSVTSRELGKSIETCSPEVASPISTSSYGSFQ